MGLKLRLRKYVYVLYREVINKQKNKTFYYYFNSTFFEHKIILRQVFNTFRWYETVESVKIEKVEEKVLDWTVVIYFNAITIHIARLFAFFMHKEWYKIAKVEVIKKIINNKSQTFDDSIYTNYTE